MTPNNKTVLFVFSFSAAIEAVRKPIFGTNKKRISEHFFEILNKNTIKLAQESGLDVVVINEKHQKGNTFSERYFNAYKSLFEKGYQKVISIGNDTPNLTLNHINSAISSLETQEMVFGPAKDGGVYLLGFSKSAFNEKAFKNFSWLTSSVSNEIKNFALQNKITFCVLEKLQDIDSKNNALEYAYTNLNSIVSSFILFYHKLYKAVHKPISIVPPELLSLHKFYLRGPPLA